MSRPGWRSVCQRKQPPQPISSVRMGAIGDLPSRPERCHSVSPVGVDFSPPTPMPIAGWVFLFLEIPRELILRVVFRHFSPAGNGVEIGLQNRV